MNEIKDGKPSESLYSLIKNADSKIVIVAPYIKSHAFKEIIDLIPDSVDEFVCITRWQPADIASGSCDIEIFDDISNIKGGKLLMNPLLHAKYYSNEEIALVGSANLTLRGLGLCTPCNFELLIEIPKTYSGLQNWEENLINTSIYVTEELRDKIFNNSIMMNSIKNINSLSEVETEIDTIKDFWLPKCTSPERLWDVYSGRGLDDMIPSAFEAANEDLQFLSIPYDLNKLEFESFVKTILVQIPIIIEIDKLSEMGIKDNIAQEVLIELNLNSEISFDPVKEWKILKNWLLHFFPKKYIIEKSEPIFVKGREYN